MKSFVFFFFVALCSLFFSSNQLSFVEAKSDPYPILLTAPWTPFYPNFSINYDIIDAQIAMSKQNGVTHVWVSGLMSQFDQLTIQERMQIAQVYLKAIKKQGLYSILQVGHQTIAYAQQLAAYAESIGYDAIAVLPPFAPEKPTSLAELVYILSLIASQAPKTAFYYYHIPGTTGLYYNMSDLLIATQGGVIPTMAGIKYVYGDLQDYANCLALDCSYSGCVNGKYNVMWAPNPKIQSLPYGARGFVLAENYWASCMIDIYNAWYVKNNQTLAQEIQDYCNSLFACEQDGKSIMRALGVDLGPNRLPQYPVDPYVYIQQCECLSELDFFSSMNIVPNCNPPSP